MSIGEGSSQSLRLTPSQVQPRDAAVTQAPSESSPSTNLENMESTFLVSYVITTAFSTN